METKANNSSQQGPRPYLEGVQCRLSVRVHGGRLGGGEGVRREVPRQVVQRHPAVDTLLLPVDHPGPRRLKPANTLWFRFGNYPVRHVDLYERRS